MDGAVSEAVYGYQQLQLKGICQSKVVSTDPRRTIDLSDTPEFQTERATSYDISNNVIIYLNQGSNWVHSVMKYIKTRQMLSMS